MKVLLFVWMAACIVVAAKASHQQAEIASGNGPGTSVAHDDSASGPDKAMHFIVTFTNRTSEDLTFIPGTLALCGMTPSKTSEVKLNLTDAQGQHHLHLPYWGDGPVWACSGYIELFIAVLHRGESLSLPLDVGKYVDLSDSKQYKGARARFLSGKYSLQAELTAEASDIPRTLKTKNIWVGRATSNTVHVQFTSEFSLLPGAIQTR